MFGKLLLSCLPLLAGYVLWYVGIETAHAVDGGPVKHPELLTGVLLLFTVAIEALVLHLVWA